MSLIIRKRVCDSMSEGLHSVTITKVEDLGLEATRSGTKDMAAIYLTADDQNDKEGKPVDACLKVIQTLHPKSNLVKLLTQLGVPFGDTFDLNEVVGISCQVVIQHEEEGGKTNANVVAVLKLSKRGILSHAQTPCVA
jgi:hypothetical protein